MHLHLFSFRIWPGAAFLHTTCPSFDLGPLCAAKHMHIWVNRPPRLLQGLVGFRFWAAVLCHRLLTQRPRTAKNVILQVPRYWPRHRAPRLARTTQSSRK
jgi:hypothetical protein